MATPDADMDYRALFQGAPGLYLVLTPDFVIVAASDAYLKATMTTREQVIGHGLFEIFPDNPDEPGATGETNLGQSLQRVVESCQPDAMAIQKYDVRGADGIFEERFWSPLNVPLLDADGRVRWIIHRAEDVTEIIQAMRSTADRDAAAREQESLINQLRRTNEALLSHQGSILAREAHLHSVLETAPDAVVVIDEAGIVRSFNQAGTKIFGYEPAEVIGHNVRMLMPEADAEKHDDHLVRYGQSRERHVIGTGRQTIALRKDGSAFPIELTVGEVRTGGTHFFTGFVRDLSERVAIEEQLRQSQKMEAIGQLTGGIAHDFNNLLNIVICNLELLIEDAPEGSESRELHQMALDASLRGAELIRHMLAFARKQRLEPARIEINDFVSGMMNMLKRGLGERVAVKLRQGTGLWSCVLDPAQLQMALTNLATNARDAMPLGGQLVIETANTALDDDYVRLHPDTTPGDYVMIAVSDTGGGMPPAVVARAFDPFFTTKGEGRGTGLGLSMVFGFVKQSAGHIRIYSETGLGTTIKLYLPRADNGGKQPGGPAVPAAKPVSTRHSGCLLVVEDNLDLAASVKNVLTSAGYKVIVAHSAVEALAVVDADATIDLIFTDVILAAGMNGLDLAAEAVRRRPGLRALLTSGFAEPALVMDAPHITNLGILSKPYRRAELLERLAGILHQEEIPGE